MSSTKTQKTEPPRIFISHAWEDKAFVRQLEKALADAGADVWVDHAGIRGGDNLPKRINDALSWCNTLLLVWSKASADSHWVELEWTNAISLRKLIVPCPLDGTPLPPILANMAYVDFSDKKKGLRELQQALRLANAVEEESEAATSLVSVIHERLTRAEAPTIPKPPHDEQVIPPPHASQSPASKPVQPQRSVIIQLRATPINPLSEDAVKEMLREKNFYDKHKNSSGKGIRHEYEILERHGVVLVIDRATGLMWQKGGSKNYWDFKDAEAYIQKLNAKKFGDCSDWRLPTLEEATSLVEKEKKSGDLYIDPVFDRAQRWIWTTDKESAGREWRVLFDGGSCTHLVINFNNSVRAVCLGQSSI
ncbi:MAG: TIR domain-containing protein [bacterium]